VIDTSTLTVTVFWIDDTDLRRNNPVCSWGNSNRYIKAADGDPILRLLLHLSGTSILSTNICKHSWSTNRFITGSMYTKLVCFKYFQLSASAITILTFNGCDLWTSQLVPQIVYVWLYDVCIESFRGQARDIWNWAKT
jgi:hypothetical protein